MSKSRNRVELIGYVGKEPMIRVMPSGKMVVNLRMATTEHWTDDDGKKQEATEWHNVVLFDRLAELAQKYVHTGRQLLVEGKLRTRKFTDKDNVDRYSTEIVGRDLMLLGVPSEAATAKEAAEKEATPSGLMEYDDIAP